MVANTKPSPVMKSQGMCGDCVGRLFTGQHPVDGYQCPLCRHIWMSAATRAAYRIKCSLCNEHWLEGEGHICPTLPIPRRREAIYATKRNQNGCGS